MSMGGAAGEPDGNNSNNNDDLMLVGRERVLEKSKEKEKLKKPSMYAVLLHNDDFTAMDFVVFVLRRVFNFNEERAQILMMTIHTKGLARCGVFTRDIAFTKQEQVKELSSEQEYPLRCTVEKIDD